MLSTIDKIVSLCKRRGFVFPSAEIYGGLAGIWDYGPLGFLLKENIKREWWRQMLSHDNIYPLDAAILTSAKVLERSGHVEHFSDLLVDCKKCKKRFRLDEIREKCPECSGQLTQGRQFNMMFKTYAGPVQEESSLVYLRPETAQGIFVNFKNVVDSFHPELPFGIAQVGKAFRNEITPRHFLFRAREFEQLELEYFGFADKMAHYFEFIKEMRYAWFLALGIQKKNIRFRDYKKDELAHYAKATTDIEYRFGLSKEKRWGELEGIANRGDFDLKNHGLTYKGITPHVIEPSLGLDRAFFAFLIDAYSEDKGRIVLKLHPKLAPYTAAVFPLLANKPDLVKLAKKVYEQLRKNFSVAWDDRGNIGKRYYSQDEIGTPYCVTIDFQSLKDKTVTLRDRNTTKQERVAIKDLIKTINKNLQ